MEIKNELKKQNVIDIKQITIRKLNQTIDTNSYILTFNNPKPPPEMKTWIYVNKSGKVHPKSQKVSQLPKNIHI